MKINHNDAADITLLVDNEFKTSLEDFIKANTAEDVEPLTMMDINCLNILEVGEEIYIGIVSVKRIS